MVVDAETGLLVPPQSPEALAQALVRLAVSPTERLAFGRAGRLRAESHFSLPRHAAQLQAAYDTLLSARP